RTEGGLPSMAIVHTIVSLLPQPDGCGLPDLVGRLIGAWRGASRPCVKNTAPIWIRGARCRRSETVAVARPDRRAFLLFLRLGSGGPEHLDSLATERVMHRDKEVVGREEPHHAREQRGREWARPQRLRHRGGREPARGERREQHGEIDK